MGDLTPATAKRTLSRVTGAAGIIMLATLLSRVTGFLRTALIQVVMMPKGYSDEFILAFSLPDIAFNLLAGGAIAAALIPVMSSFLSKGKEEDAWKALSTFLNISMIAMLVMEVVFLIWTDGILALVAAGYSGKGKGDRQMLVTLTRILLLNVPFMMLAGQCNGILNSYRKFAAAAFGPVIYNICTIVGIGVFGGTNVYLVAWAIVGSAAVFLLVQMAATWRHFKRYRLTLEWRHPAFRRMMKLAVPSLMSSSIVEFNNVVTRGFATFLPEGMLTLLNSANRTWQLPMGIFAQSIGIAMLPTLSAHHAANEKDAFRRLFNRGVRAVFLISLPMAVIMMVENQQIMRLLFKWGGGVPESDVYYSGIALLGYGSALIFASILGMTIRAFYAMHDSITPLVNGILGIGVNIGFNALFQHFTNFGIAGTALSYSITSLFNMLILLVVFSRKTGIRFFSDNGAFFGKCFAAMVPSGALLYALTLLIRPAIDSKASQIICMAIPAVACCAAFYFMALAFRIHEVSVLRDMVAGKFKKFRKNPEGMA
jgi:putative peptidoglycan lipid II flippase